jgi:hypothetical protein
LSFITLTPETLLSNVLTLQQLTLAQASVGISNVRIPVEGKVKLYSFSPIIIFV